MILNVIEGLSELYVVNDLIIKSIIRSTELLLELRDWNFKNYKTTQSKTLKISNLKKSFRERRFRCEESDCGKGYTTRENLILHVTNVHMRIKPYSCQFCKKFFAHRNGKKYHERTKHQNLLKETDSVSH